MPGGHTEIAVAYGTKQNSCCQRLILKSCKVLGSTLLPMSPWTTKPAQALMAWMDGTVSNSTNKIHRAVKGIPTSVDQ
jgi:hypothetical protein